MKNLLRFKRNTTAWLLALGLLGSAGAAYAGAHAAARTTDGADSHSSYALDIGIDPTTHVLDVSATVVLPAQYAGQTLEFLLTDAVEILDSSAPVERLPYDGSVGFSGINGTSVELTEEGNVAQYRVSMPAGVATLTLRYKGVINFALGDLKEQYTRGFRSTAGLIDSDGIYLAGSSLWYPFFSNELLSFNLSSNVPEGWHLISQGNGTSRDADGMSAWDSAGLVDEIYLVGGPLQRYAEGAGAVQAEVYLRETDDGLARKYLDATAQYLEMYRNLIGPYPYGKFALVENFWETGYGMPSFTLLGPQIIRFPFILTSSYPHEILHNWWGNSVFVDYDTGNWCEGLTAYMADHLMQELRGTGAVWRRDTLKKYRDFVKDGNDFPLTEFRSRHNAATEAVGYGKVAMGFHMLRRQLGDDEFKRAMQTFYRENRGSKASFADVQASIEGSSGAELGEFFEQWVQRTGAPDLELGKTRVSRKAGRYRIRGVIKQLQSGEPYTLDVPVYVTTTAGLETFTVTVNDAATNFDISTEAQPLLLEVDPEFDLFRLLDPRETAPSIGQIFGESEILAVMPAAASAEQRRLYEELIDSWRSGAHAISIVMDNELSEIPADKAAWLLGADNALALDLFGRDPAIDVDFGADALLIAGESLDQRDHSSVIVRRHPANPAKAVGWIAVAPAAAFPGVSGKLPHYGKYSYLGFAGDEPANMLKGEWAATDSPLRRDLRKGDERFAGQVAAARPPARAALAELPPVFSATKLMNHVTYLASEELAGRGLGTPGLELAADYIAKAFAEAGLQPGGHNGTYSQYFAVDEGEDGRPHQVRNIIGVLPGSNPELAEQMLLITAHYDHLGSGWPDVRADAGEGIYYGADDNASGVAVLIEVAAALAAQGAPERTIVFVAFTGEEAGLLGSQYFAANPLPYPLSGVNAVLNMDTVGRLEGKDISVFGAASASDWAPIFRGIGFTTGVPTKLITADLDSSDHTIFIGQGIPAVQISSGASLDYHRPTDTVDKVDVDGMVKVAVVVKEAAVYLAERPEPLNATISGAAASPQPRQAGDGGRRVSVGTVPDFAFQGKGVRLEGVVPGSPAAQAEMQVGDVLVELAGQEVDGLRGYTNILKTLEPGQRVTLTFERGGERIQREVDLVER
ncbi:MAG: M20/M25/M40 family metallo-hydrolase [Gammaproteobacteria bacterium]|nr:M20/M25/M40 family metallo-hydrolase [Gammaproteobacteria bacterium]